MIIYIYWLYMLHRYCTVLDVDLSISSSANIGPLVNNDDEIDLGNDIACHGHGQFATVVHAMSMTKNSLCRSDNCIVLTAEDGLFN